MGNNNFIKDFEDDQKDSIGFRTTVDLKSRLIKVAKMDGKRSLGNLLNKIIEEALPDLEKQFKINK